ncbi:MAG: 30S ribosomal protein S9 [Phycisphaeraceae bacterium]|nr:30S ribosomal protein S9 [Phycisphaeraceae bacterium]
MSQLNVPDFSIDDPITNDPEAPAKPRKIERVVREPAAAKHGWWWGTGRRKTSVARVRLRPAQSGEGKILLMSQGDTTKTVEQFFAEERDRSDCIAPLKVTNTLGKMDVIIRCTGGGFMGQAGAAKLGLARALRGYDPNLEGALRDHGMLTRDARDVERKKYGQAGARRRFQFSKR